MSYLLVLVGFMVAALIALAIALWRLGGQREDRLDLASLSTGCATAELYLPMKRLFSLEDREYLGRLCDRPAGMQRRLHSGRQRVFRLYLRQIRKDFAELWRLARAIAPMSRNPEFGSLIAQQFLSFHALYWIIQVRCALGWTAPVGVDVGDLVGALERLRVGTQRVLGAQQPDVRVAVNVQ